MKKTLAMICGIKRWTGPIVWLCVGLVVSGVVLRASELVLVDGDQAHAVVVTADAPSPVAELAADELVSVVEQATGVALPVVTEANAPLEGVRIYIGDTQAARKAGLNPDVLPGETYRIKAEGGNLYIFGNEDGKDLLVKPEALSWPWESFVLDARRGTLYGVVEFLDRHLDALWLWPGDLGRYVPQRRSVFCDTALDITQAPRFKYRRYRIGVLNREIRGRFGPPDQQAKYGKNVALSFTDDGARRYFDALRRYLLIHHEGCTEPQPRVGHHFQGWWSRYGKEHPEWFSLHDDGTRGPWRGNAYQVRMCVSNPELQRFIVEKDWNGENVLSLGEADRRGFCRCETCKAWDHPQPEGFGGYSTANRYVRFAQAVHKLAVKRNPNVKITMFLYVDYTHAPTIKADLSWMYGKFVPWGSGHAIYYPMTTAKHELNKASWLGWHKTGMTMCYRPNHLLGYTMPNLNTRQTGEMVRFAAANGMEGFDYDSLWGQWAVKGPMLYMHIRLGVNPDLTVDEVRNEYFSAFGPAAKQIEKYFDYWEDYSVAHLSKLGRDYIDCSKSHELFPPEVFAWGKSLLSEAMKQAETSELPEFAARVKFLQDGLTHAELAAIFVGFYEAQKFAKARQALLNLQSFRRAHEQHFIADYSASARTENRTYKDLDDLLEGKLPTPKERRPKRPPVDIGTGWMTPWETWRFLKDPKAQGLPEAQFVPETFDPEGWTETEVGQNLDSTHVGPYNGYGWYAVPFEIPKDWADRDVEILFEGIDKQAWVYVNGHLVDEITPEAKEMTVEEIWANPFIVNVPASDLNVGATNMLVVRIHSEFGAMGLYRPVRLRPVDLSTGAM